jgi:hypothetical protein
VRPDEAVVKGLAEGGLDDKKTSMGGGNLLVCQVLSPLSLPPFKKVGSRCGSAGVFGLVSRVLLGLWHLWFPCWGSTGGRCFSPTYSGPGVC